jgi:hypothetical protein
MLYFFKTAITSIVIVAIMELSKRSIFLGALLASLPLTSVLSLIWIYYDSKDTQKIIEISYSIFWLVMPSLVFFLILPFALKSGFKFIPSMLIASVIMIMIYIAGLSLYNYLAK